MKEVEKEIVRKFRSQEVRKFCHIYNNKIRQFNGNKFHLIGQTCDKDNKIKLALKLRNRRKFGCQW